MSPLFRRRDEPPPDPNQLDLPLAPLIIPDPAPTIAERFTAFHEANPWVADALVRLALDLVHRGQKRIGVKMLWEVLRWHHIRYVSTGEPFKLNNDFTAHYARLLVEQHTELADVFETRKLRTP